MLPIKYIFGQAVSDGDVLFGLRYVGYGCYGFAVIALLCGLSKVPHGLPIASAFVVPTVFVMAGYFLPRYISRIYAAILTIYALYFSVGTYALVGHGVAWNFILITDVVFTVVLLWVALRGLYLTTAYHKFHVSRVDWRNVAIIWGSAIGGIFAVAVFAAVLVNVGLISPSTGETVLYGGVALTCTHCFLVMTRRFRLVSMPLAMVEVQRERRAVSTQPRDKHADEHELLAG